MGYILYIVYLQYIIPVNELYLFCRVFCEPVKIRLQTCKLGCELANWTVNLQTWILTCKPGSELANLAVNLQTRPCTRKQGYLQTGLFANWAICKLGWKLDNLVLNI